MVNWGKSCETGKIPQPEATEKQAGWGKSCEIGKIPQPEAAGKQAGLGKSCEIRKIPQPEAVGKQVICTLFTGQPVRRVFLCVIVMSLN